PYTTLFRSRRTPPAARTMPALIAQTTWYPARPEKSPTMRGPTTAPVKSPVIITPTAAAGRLGAAAVVASVPSPDQLAPRPPASSAPSTTAAGFPVASSRNPADPQQRTAAAQTKARPP